MNVVFLFFLVVWNELGFNTLRVFLSSVVWQNDATGMKKRVDEFFEYLSEVFNPSYVCVL